MNNNCSDTKSRKWYTCTPVAFKGDHTFFHRDSGLFCKAFQEIGVESKAVMPLPAQEGDWPDLIRTEYKNLESAAWWKSLEVDGVVLYAWTKTRYTPIARAIRNSGAKLVLYLDVGALTYPWKDWCFGTRLIFRSHKARYPHLYIPWSILEIIRAHTLKPLNTIRRRKHLDYANLIGIPSPQALEAYIRIPFLFSDKSRAAVTLLPVPVASHFHYNPNIQKEDRIIAVGRWNDESIKRPRFLMKALECFCIRDGYSQIEIFGLSSMEMKAWHDLLPASIQSRISFHGVVESNELAHWYNRSKICLCPSIRESTHLASAEALCCGCSVVACPSPGLAAVAWYASKNSGMLGETDTSEALASAMINELKAWEQGFRNPIKISTDWRQTLHAKETAAKVIRYFERNHTP